MWFAVGIAVGMAFVALYLTIRYRMLKKCIEQAGTDLEAILESPEENRILFAAAPSREAEQLLKQINRYIEFHQRERIVWQQQERQLQEQIENISHDLRTPLTAILGYLELVDDSRLSGEDREALAVVERKSRYLQGLIRDFYDLSRLERADMRLKQEPVEITRLIRETVLSYYPEFEERHLRVELELPERAVPIMGNQEALERILHNMIQNALRYARSHFRVCVYNAEGKDRQESGAGRYRQEGRERQEAQAVQEDGERQEARAVQEGRERQEARAVQEGRESQEVRDDDTAGKRQICLDFGNDTEHLTQEDIPCLFDRFYMADHARPSGSTGLGLTISKLLAEVMGGSVTAQLTEQGELHLVFVFSAQPGNGAASSKAR